MAVHELLEFRYRRIRPEGAEQDCQTLRRWTRLAGETREDIIRAPLAELLIEAVQIDSAFLIDEALQIILAERILLLRLNILPLGLALGDIIIGNVAQEANEHEIDRMRETILNRVDIAAF